MNSSKEKMAQMASSKTRRSLLTCYLSISSVWQQYPGWSKGFGISSSWFNFVAIFLLLSLFCITPAYAVSLNKAIVPNVNVNPGQTVQLQLTVFNDAISGGVNIPLTNAAFFDDLNLFTDHPNMKIASPNNLSNNCPGATITAVPGTQLISVTGMTVPAKVGAVNGRCDVYVDITTTQQGNTVDTIPINNLTNTEGYSNAQTASATLTVNTVLAPTLGLTVTQSTIYLGQATTLKINVTNNASISLTNTAWTNTLPAGIQIHSTPNLTTSAGCLGATATAPAGGGTITLSNTTIAAGATCTVSVDVTGNLQGNYLTSMPASAITTTQGVTNATLASQNIAVQSFNVGKGFSIPSVKTNQVSTMTITINSVTAYTNLAFTDDFAALGLTGLVIATPANASTTCNNASTPTLTATAGTQLVKLINGSIGAGSYVTPASCIVKVDVVYPSNPATTVNLTNSIPIGGITGQSGAIPASNINLVTATLTVNPYVVPTLTKGFATDPIFVGQSSTLSINVKNNDAASFTGVGWTDTLPAGLIVNGAAAKNAACSGGSVTPAVAGGAIISLSGVTVASGATCTVTVPVTATQQGGPYANTMLAGSITDNQGTSNIVDATATLNIVNTLTASKAFAASPVAVGVPTTLTITISNASTHGYNSLAFTDSFITAPNSLANLKIAPTPNASTTCGTGSVTAVANSQSVALSSGQILGGTSGVPMTCIVKVDVVASAGFASKTNTIPIGGVTGVDATNSTTGSSYQAATASISAQTVTAPTLGKSFSTSPVFVGVPFTLTITVKNNDGTFPLTNVHWTDTLPTGLQVATGSITNSACGSGVVNAPVNGVSIALTGGTIGVGLTCTITVPVVATQESHVTGFDNTMAAGAVLDDQNVTNASLVTANVKTQAFSVAKTFNGVASATIAANIPTKLRVTITNGSTHSYNALTFTDDFSTMNANLVISTPSNATTTCTGGSVTTPTTQSVKLTAGTLAASGNCYVEIDVVSPVAFASATNTIPIGAVSATDASNSTSATSYTAASANLAVQAVSAPTLGKSFSASPVFVGVPFNLTITVKNNDATYALTNTSWSDTLPSGLQVSAGTITKTNCGTPTVTAPVGVDAGSISFTGGTIATGASSTCTVVVPVVATQESHVTGFTNNMPINAVNNDQKAQNAAIATANVKTQAFSVAKTFNGVASATIAANIPTKLRVTITNGSTHAYNALAFTDNFSAMNANLVISTPSNATTTCTGGTVTTPTTQSVALSAGTLAASGSCIVEVDVVSPVAFASATNSIPIGTVSATDTSNSTVASSYTAASANLAVQAVTAPTLGKSFSAGSPFFVGQPFNLTITVKNNDPTYALTNVTWTDNLPTGLQVSAGTITKTNCGTPTVAATVGADAGSIVFTGGTIATGATCTVVVPVVANRDNQTTGFDNTMPINAVNNDQKAKNAAAATVNVKSQAFTATKFFNGLAAGTQVHPNVPVTLKITISNNSTDSYSALAFTDNLASVDPNLKVAATPNASTTCTPGGTVTASPGASTVSLSGGKIGAGTAGTAATCDILVDVVSAVAFSGVKTNTIAAGAITATAVSNSTAASSYSAASASFNVIPVAPPTIAKAFTTNAGSAPPSVYVGQTSTLSITVSNNDLLIPLTGVTFADTIPTYLTMTGAPTSTNCGTPTINVVGSTINFSGGTIAVGATCTVSVGVKADRQSTNSNVAGFTNTIPVNGVTSNETTTSNIASASLTVDSLKVVKSFNGNTNPTQTTVKVGDLVKLRVTINNYSTHAYNNISFTDNFSTINPNFKITNPRTGYFTNCTGTVTATAGTQLISLTGGSLAAGSSGAPTSCYIEVDTVATAAFTVKTNTINAGTSDCTAGTGLTGTDSSNSTVACDKNGSSADIVANSFVDPTLNKLFTPASVYVGQNTTLSITVKNNDTSPLTGVTYTDTLPVGFDNISSTPTSTNCGTPTITVTGGLTINFSGGTIAAGATCTVNVVVTANRQTTTNTTTLGQLTNSMPINAVTTNGLTGSNAASITLPTKTLQVVKSFNGNTSPTLTTVKKNDLVKLRVTINNYSTHAYNSIAFTDTFSGMDANFKITSPVTGYFTNCIGTVTAAAGTQVISLTGGTLPAGNATTPSSCYIEVNTVATAAFINKANTITAALATCAAGTGLTAIDANTTPACDQTGSSANLTVASFIDPVPSKSFSPNPVYVGQTSILSINVLNNDPVQMTGVAYTDSMPTGLSVITTTTPTYTNCGTPTINLTTTQIQFSGGTIAGGGTTCTVNVAVVADRQNVTATPLTNNLPANAVTTNGLTASVAASASLTANSLQIVKTFNGLTGGPTPINTGDIVKLRLTINNYSSHDYKAIAFSDNFSGMNANYKINTPNGLVTNCSYTTLTATAGTQLVSLSGGTLAAGNATIPTSCYIEVDTVATATFNNKSNTIAAGAATCVAGTGLTATDNISSTPACDKVGTTASATATTFSKPTVTKTIAGSPKLVGQSGAVLTIKVTNTENSASLTGVHWTDTLPAGMEVNGAVTNTNCGTPTITTPSNTSIVFIGGTITNSTTTPANVCTVTVPIVGKKVSAGLLNSMPTGSIGDNENVTDNAGPYTATLVVTNGLSITKAFGTGTINVGNTSTLTITVSNTAYVPYTLTVSDDLSTMTAGGGVYIAPTPNASTTCTGGVITFPGSQQITMTGGTIVAATSATAKTCTIQVDVVGNIPSSPTGTNKVNTIPVSALTTAEDVGATNTAAATANLKVNALVAPTISKTFNGAATATIKDNGTNAALLRITITNPNNIATNSISVSDTFPGALNGLVIYSTPAAVNTCGGTLTATAGTNSISLTGGTLAALSAAPLNSCYIEVPVVSTLPFASSNNTANLTSIQTSAGQTLPSLPLAASAAIAATDILTATKTFAKTPILLEETTRLTVTITNDSAVAKTGLAFSDTTVGSNIWPTSISVATPSNISNTCGGSITIASANAGFSLTGGSIAALSSCTIALDIIGSTVSANQTNTIKAAAITTTQGAIAAADATAVIRVNNATTLYDTLTKQFNLSTITLTDTSTVTISWRQASGTSITPSVTDNLPSGMRVADIPNVSATCTTAPVPSAALVTSSISAARDQIIITFPAAPSAFTQASGQVCSVSYDVVPKIPTVTAVAGALTNTIYPGNIRSASGTTVNTTSVSATLAVNDVLTIAKTFQPDQLGPNGISLLTITITNPEFQTLTNAGLTDNLPVNTPVATNSNNLVVADYAALSLPAPTTNCTLTGSPDSSKVAATAGGTTITLSGGIIPPKVGATAGVCTISAYVKPAGSYTSGTSTNTINPYSISTTEGRSNKLGTSAAITYTSPSLGAGKAFLPVQVQGGSVSRLTVTIINPQTYTQTGIAFTDAMPTGMTIGAPPNPTTTCTGGSFTGVTVGSGTWSFSGGSVPPNNASCSVAVNATMEVEGNLTNTIPIGGITTNNGGSNSQKAEATLTNLAGASFGKSFSPNPMVVNQTTRLTINVTNSSNLKDLTNMGFVDDLTLGNTQTGLTVASTPNITNTCGGTVTINPAKTLITLAGGALAHSSVCTVQLDLVALTEGSYINRIPSNTLTNNETVTNADPSQDTLVVNSSIKVVKQLNLSTDSGRFNFTMTPAAPTGASTRTAVGHDADINAVTPFAAHGGTTYTITETGSGVTSLANYITTYVCTNADNTTVTSGTGTSVNITPPASGGTVTPNQQAITCIFTNTNKQPMLTVNKVSIGDIGSFTFTGNNGMPTSATAITTTTAGVSATVAALSNVFLTATNVATTITEGTLPADFALSGASCTGLQGADTASLAGNTLTVPATSVVNGARIVCTFTNSKTSLDHGDAPAALGDASHSVPTTPSVYLGNAVPDADSSANVTAWQLQTTADGDDITGIADEGIAQLQNNNSSSFPVLTTTPGTYSLTLRCSGTTTTNAVSGWIDFNRNNSFEAGEQARGSCSSVMNGTVTLTWNTFTGINSGLSYARFRIASNAVESGSATSITGATDGEVEDYPITIIKTPTVKVEKTTLGGFGGPFSFAQTNLASAPADISTVAVNTVAPVSPTAINVLTTGMAVTLAESPAPGYTLTSASCSDANRAVTGNPISFGSLVGNVLTIPAGNVVAAADITCDFINTLSTTVKVQKITLGGFGGSFSFTKTNLVSTPSSITTTAVNTATPATPTGINVTTLGTDVTLTETLATGYTLTSASCTDANSGVTGNSGFFGFLTGNVLTIPAANVVVGADISCTFTNSKIPTVKVQKITRGDFGGPFSIAQTNLASAPADISTTAVNTATPASPAAINVTTTGTDVTLTETVVTGYFLSSASCTDANTGITGNTNPFGSLVGNVLTIPAANVVVGADITCIFTNSKIPAVKVQKRTIGGFGGPFSFAQTNLVSVPADINTTIANTLTPGTPSAINVTTLNTDVTLTETSIVGYTLTAASCFDANNGVTGNPASFGLLAGNVLTIPAGNVRAGADITCIFSNSNTTTPTVKIQKTTLGGFGGPFSFTETNLASAPANISTVAVNTASPASPTAINVSTTGTAVTLTEIVASGYTLTSASCSDANSGMTGNPASFGSLAGNVLTIAPANVVGGADITCNFTNTRIPTVKVQKTTLNGFGGPFSFSETNLMSAPANITTTAANTASPASPTAINVTTTGTDVTLTETLASNYTLTSASCSDANSAVTGNPASFGSLAGNVLTIAATNVRAGADISCDFNNTYVPANFDYSDAPAAYGAPSHAVPATPTVYLGNIVPDIDTSSNAAIWQGQTTATGDDNDNTEDEGIIQLFTNGNSFPAISTTTTTYTLTLWCSGTTTANAVSGWIDFNNNNVFNAGEHAQGTCSASTGGTVTLTWSGLSGVVAGTTYARFRIASLISESGSATGMAADGEVEDYVVTITGGAYTITGTVFKDTGTSGGTANNGIQDGGETGITAVTVKLTNCSGTTYDTATTGGTGDYSLSATTAPAGAVCVEESNLSGYTSIGANTTVGSVTTADKITFTLAANTNYTGLNFGDVPPNQFLTDGAKTGVGGTTVIYPHSFIAATTGSVTFSLPASTATPSLPGWNETLYTDANCDAVLDAPATTLTLPVAVTEGQTYCLIQQEFIPNGAPQGASNLAPVRATFVYTGATAITATIPAPVANGIYNHQDLTTVNTTAVFLQKEVRNITRPTTPDWKTSNNAKSGETLEYRITYTNNSPSAISTLEINDGTPAFTTFVSALCDTVIDATPTSLGQCKLVKTLKADNTGTLKWTFIAKPPTVTTPQLLPGGKGSVTFRVLVD